MCGIAGLIDLNGNPINPEILKCMTEVICHRGPDDEGYALLNQKTSKYQAYAGSDSSRTIQESYPQFKTSNITFEANLGLGHRRFSIIDLSSSGHQPFLDKDNTCCVVYNGEIYNYIELRAELENCGVVFRSHSDTEVLLEAYKTWGVDCFRRCIGFWALALYDFQKKQLILSRDHLGKKPLYWTRIRHRIYFASEIKSLLRVPELAKNKKVNLDAIWHWIDAGLRDMNSSTCFEGIFTLPSASWTIVDENFPNKINTFWKIPDERMNEADISISKAAASVRETLEKAVSIRLRSDVPLAFELSGGLDSSTILALAAKAHPERITTYTVRFSDPRWDEEPFARSVAKHYNIDYRVIDSPLDTIWHKILSFTYLQEEPFHSPNMQTNQAIWTLMRTHGTKVVLNGVAGDEMFAGYPRYFPDAQSENIKTGNYYQYIKNALFRSERENSFRTLALSPAKFAWHLLKYKQRAKSLHWRNSSYLRNIVAPQTMYSSRTLTKSLYMDATNTLIPYWLRLSDKVSMGVPIESRSPFLDYRVVELAMQLPVTYLVRNGWHKWILRKALEDCLPHDVLWRKRKMGFPFPYREFYKNSKNVIDIIMHDMNNPYLDFSKNGKPYIDWTVISFILWYELFFNENLLLFEKIEGIFQRTQNTSISEYIPEFLTSCVPV